MGFYRYFLVVLLILFSFAANAGNCEVIGKINEIIIKDHDGSAYVLRSNCPAQQRISVYTYQWIFDGDRFEITGDAEVHVVLAKGQKRILTQHDSGKLLREQSINDVKDQQNSLYGKITSAIDLWKQLERQRKSIPFFNKVRGFEQNYTIREDPLLPAGIQYLPIGYEQIALIWRGGPAIADLSTYGEIREFQSGNWAYLFMPIPEITNESFVRLREQNINWQIKVSTNIPIPQGIYESDLASPASQLMRALWILEQQDLTNWRLFALSEIAKLSRMGIFSAEELWKAVLSGELATALQAM